MDIDVLRYFKAAVQCGNFSKAAKELHISQPTLTVAMQKLEQELKVVLFERSRKGISLTRPGEHVYQYAEEVLRSWEALRQQASQSQDAVAGTARLGVHASVACYFLPIFLPAFLQRYPHAEIELHHDISRNVLAQVQNNRIDAALVINPEKIPDLIMKEILRDKVTVWKRKGALNPDVLLADPALFQTEWILKKLQKKGIHFPRKVVSGNLEVIAGLLRSGCGHAILPERVARQIPCPLEPSFPAIPAYQDTLYLVYRAAFGKTALGRALIQSILAETS